MSLTNTCQSVKSALRVTVTDSGSHDYNDNDSDKGMEGKRKKRKVREGRDGCMLVAVITKMAMTTEHIISTLYS